MPAMANGAGGWIICRGAERPVVGGAIWCPLHGSVDLLRCLDCHLLETVVAERRADRECEGGTREPIGTAV